MIHLVLDANVAIDWFIPSEIGQAYSMPLMKQAISGDISFHTPIHFNVEVCGQLVKCRRRKLALFEQGWLDTSLDTLDVLPINAHAMGVTFKILGDLAQSYGLSVYDVPYFHLARILGLPIASRDRGIISACKTWHVEHWQPD